MAELSTYIPLGKIVKGRFGGKLQQVLVMDTTQAAMEERYFAIMRFLGNRPPYGRGYAGADGHVMKVKDIYTAGETSSYWGSIEQRRGAQIDKFQQIMSNVGTMLKALFQLLRELRILDERLDYYERSKKNEESAEIALKSIWVDMVEGGAKNPGSVTGLASQVGFVTLPDFFYTVHPKKTEDVEREVKKLKEGAINRKVREVLGRKLKQYMIWKERTYHELKVGQQFKLKYMRQHYNIIKLYLNWLRPYLRNIKRLQMKSGADDIDVVAAFETSKVELEILAVKKTYEREVAFSRKEPTEFKTYFPCVRVMWTFVGIPELAYQAEFQRGAVHRGRVTVKFEGLVVTKEELDAYKKKLEEEDFDLLSAVDDSLVALKDDLDLYLERAGELPEEKPVVKRDSVITPFMTLARGLQDITGALGKAVSPGKGKGPKDERGAAEGTASLDAYLAYKVYKQSKGLFTE